MLEGNVHDMAAAMMGGYQDMPAYWTMHCTLVLMQMLVNGGEYGFLISSRRRSNSLPRDILPGTRRGIGFDMPQN